MASLDADRNLLFGVLALQGELIDPGQFAEACTAWSARKDRSLADHLVDRGWISAEDRRLVEQLLERRLKKHSGDAHQSLIAAASGSAGIQDALLGVRSKVKDETINQSLADFSPPSAAGTVEYLSKIGYSSGSRDRYTLNSLHAKGGIGQVWLARDTDLDREVALKELRPDRSDNDTILRRFLQEARITGQLDHPGVVPIYDLAQGDGPEGEHHPYYTMRFIRGRTLTETIAAYHLKHESGQVRRTDLLALIQAFVGVCNTVAFAHSRGVIHRDLKGQNIILGEFGEVVLLDWGLAKFVDSGPGKEEHEADFDPTETTPYEEPGTEADSGLTAAGQVLGTPAYMAPEQAEGRMDRIGRPTDVYGLGAILYEILSGRPPFDGESTLEVLRKVREVPPVPPSRHFRSAPKALEAVCLKAMAKDPAGRYASASELADDVQHWLADEPVSAWREPWTIRSRRWIGRHRTQVAAGVAALVVAIIGLSTSLVIQTRANRDLMEGVVREIIARRDAIDQSDQALRSIEAYYKGISEDVILRRPELTALRERLLGTAQQFYEKRVTFMLDLPAERRASQLQHEWLGLEKIAELQSDIGDRESAIRARRQLLALYDRDPGRNQIAAAENMLSLGNLERMSGRPDEALKSFRNALDRYERLSKNGEWPILVKATWVQCQLGRLLVNMGRLDEGLREVEQAREILERLHKMALAGPKTSMYWQVSAHLAGKYTTLGDIHEPAGRSAEALGYYEKAKTIYVEIIANYSKTVYEHDYYRIELARTLSNVGLAMATTGKLAEGRIEVEQGKEIRASLLAEQPLNVERRSDLARSYYHLAQIQILNARATEALESISKAEELYTGIPPRGPEDVFFQACLKAMRAGLLGAGKADGELSPTERAERQRLADEAMGLIKQAIGAGFRNPNHLKNDPPLESLRSRPDFQQLLQSLDRGSR